MNSGNTSEKDQYPLSCLSFSPNWNTYQIISTNEKGYLAYGSNAETFLLDFRNKNFITSMKPPEDQLTTNLKVTSILLTEEIVFVGFSTGTICAFNHFLQNQLIFCQKICNSPIMHLLIRSNAAETPRLILFDSEGVGYELIYIHDTLKSFPLNIKCGSQVIKCCELQGESQDKKLLLTISQKGLITLWELEKKAEIFSYTTNESFSKADFFLEDHILKLGIITKKEFLLIVNINLQTLSSNEETIDPQVPKIQISPVKLSFQIKNKSKKDPEVLAAKPDILFVKKNNVNCIQKNIINNNRS